MREPRAWEHVLLAATAALQGRAVGKASPVEVATAILLSVDTYGRGTELLTSRTDQLLRPVSSQTGAAAQWTLTFHPSTLHGVSKTGHQDDTVMIGSLNSVRGWLTKVASALKRSRRSEHLLFDLRPSELRLSLSKACDRAGTPRMVPHELRHTGASADAIAGGSELALQRQGRWASTQSVKRYMKPGRYLRRLASLTAAQLVAAQQAETYLKKYLPASIVAGRNVDTKATMT